MSGHKHSHDTGRRPLRLRPLPRPAKDSSPTDELDAPALDGESDPEVEASADVQSEAVPNERSHESPTDGVAQSESSSADRD